MADNAIAAVVQMTSGEDVAKNLARAGELVHKAARRGASLVVLPENVAFMGAEQGRLAVAERFDPGAEPDGPIGRFARELSRETGAWVIWGGVPERSDDTHTNNTSVVFGARGELVARYRKIHLFDVEVGDGQTYRESAAVTPGDGPVAIDVGPLKLGLSVCYDLRFPELYRRLVDLGATALVVPAAFTLMTGKDHWHVLLRARAIESQTYVLAAAQWGKHPKGRTTYGKSLIVDPWGDVIAQASEGEGIATATLDLERVASVRRSLPCLSHRRL